jgi:hypothetical protein
MNDGRYVEWSLPSEVFPGYEWQTISQIEYHFESCKRAASHSVGDAVFVCVLGPFMN